MLNPVVWIITLLVVAGVITYFVIIFNGLIRLKRNIDKSWANIDVLLKQRYDEVPRLIEVVKGYAAHEKKMIGIVTEARKVYGGAKSVREKAAAHEVLTEAFKSIFAIAENYPALKANETFKYLQERISGLENEIADRRELYNDSVTLYNTRIQIVPDRFVARLMRCQPHELFEAKPEEKRPIKTRL
jgi:LemA protein